MKRLLKCLTLFYILFVLASGVFATTLERRLGDFVLQVSDDGGAFNLKHAPEDAASVNFFVEHNDFGSTFFSVLINDTIYQLRRGSVSSMRLLEEEGSLGLRYNIRDKLNANVVFSFVPQFSGLDDGVVKVEVTLENISSETQSVALKGIFDTFLGENSGIHFVTPRFPYVSAEESFTDMIDLEWVRSSNGNVSVQFLFDGNGISRPKMVALANKDLVIGDSWLPSIKSGRTFNSVFSYNNSAVCAIWDTMPLSPSTTSSITFYISFASRAKIPPTASFLGERESYYALNVEDEFIHADDSGVIYTIGDITDDMLNRRYIDDLLKRIRKLEENPENIDRKELLWLNAELDSILEKVRRL